MEWNVDGQWNNELSKFASYRGVDGKLRKLNETDVTNRLRDLVYSYVSSYDGDSTFLLSLKFQARTMLTGHFSKKQVAGAANWIINEYRSQQAQPAKAEDQEFTIDYSQVARPSRNRVEPSNPPTPTLIPPAPFVPAAIVAEAQQRLPDGTYTIVFKDGSYSTIRLSLAPKNMQNHKSTTQIASFLCGLDNTSDYTGFAFVNGRRATIWKAYRANTQSNAVQALNLLCTSSDPFVYGEAYAIKSGRCFICGKKLTVPASLHSGMGPTCAAKNGR